MISTKMSGVARAATFRSHAPVLRSASQTSRAVSYSALQAQTLKLSAQAQRGRLPVSQLVSPFTVLPLTRSFHAATPLFQQQQKQQEGKEEKEKKEETGEESKEEGKEEEKKKDEAPPPPHGDKSPWQVFRDTLQSEFKASKEWNESTKALASSAHQFTENENIKRARAAYEAASSATTSRTGAALKSTGQVIGKSAAWTWNTSVVKGVRKGVSATGEGLEKATRPVRETEAFKSVKEAIDDGSSSRYGGWTEKEERRRQRQLREEAELKSGKRKVEQMVEDPKYVLISIFIW
jgi:import inner membrane translocase subunit TIM44